MQVMMLMTQRIIRILERSVGDTSSITRVPDERIVARRTGPSPGGAFDPYGRAGFPAIDDARTVVPIVNSIALAVG
jgi:hypothetical protein